MIIAVIVVLLDGYALLDNSGFFDKRYRYGFFGYYTNLSNIVIWLYFLFTLFGNRFNSLINIMVMLCIAMTFLIYHFMLSPEQIKMYKQGTLGWNFYDLTNLSLHYFCPLLTVIYWVFIADKSTLEWYSGLAYLLLPLVYCGYIALRVKLNIPIGKNGEMYPYGFMDVEKYGFKSVVKNIMILCVAFGILSVIVSLVGMLIR